MKTETTSNLQVEFGDWKDRRLSERWPSRKSIRWRVRGGRRERCSRIVERSLDGLVLLTNSRDTPRAGDIVYPADSAASHRHGMREGVVLRTEAGGGDDSLVYVSILA